MDDATQWTFMGHSSIPRSETIFLRGQSTMLRMRKYLKILRTVIECIAINMVNMLFPSELSPFCLFHYQAMLKYPIAFSIAIGYFNFGIKKISARFFYAAMAYGKSSILPRLLQSFEASWIWNVFTPWSIPKITFEYTIIPILLNRLTTPTLTKMWGPNTFFHLTPKEEFNYAV